jgi:SAM-dependent methyltransferase
VKNEVRWKIAQESEKKYWRIRAKHIEQKKSTPLEWYEWRANELIKILKRKNLEGFSDGRKRILEIGCGPVGMISYFPGKYKVGIDPLNSYYESNQFLVEMRKKNTKYEDGIAEDLQFEKETFDIVIIENCIDHVKNLKKVMYELHRVLSKDGLLYLTVNCRTSLGYSVHRLMSRLKIDKSHPHTFTIEKTKNLLENYLLKVLYVDKYSSYREAFINDIKSKDIKNNLKAVLGVSEYLVRTLSKKEK